MTERLIRKPELRERVGASDASIYRWEKAGNVPRRSRMGKRAVAWRSSDVERWMAGAGQTGSA